MQHLVTGSKPLSICDSHYGHALLNIIFHHWLNNCSYSCVHKVSNTMAGGIGHFLITAFSWNYLSSNKNKVYMSNFKGNYMSQWLQRNFTKRLKCYVFLFITYSDLYHGHNQFDFLNGYK